MSDQVRPLFLTHRFVTDAIGHLVGSYVAHAAIYAIDNVSHTPSEFSHLMALLLAASLILADYVFATRLGNKNWFGLRALVIASLIGFIVFALILILFFGIRDGFTTTASDILIGWSSMSLIFLPPVLVFPLIIRLMALPLVAFFGHDER